MICGGRDKNIDFSGLRDLVKKKVKTMIVIGEAKEKLKKTFVDVVEVEEGGPLDQAVSRAKALATQGDCVLLSPMCASFDMFKNFEHRGQVFKEIVRNLNGNQINGCHSDNLVRRLGVFLSESVIAGSREKATQQSHLLRLLRSGFPLESV